MGQAVELQNNALGKQLGAAARCITARGGDGERARRAVNDILTVAQHAFDRGSLLSHHSPSVVALHSDREAWRCFVNAMKRAFRLAGGKGTLSLSVKDGFVHILAA